MLYRLYPVLTAYKEAYPAVEIIMENRACPMLRKALGSGELDLAILLERRRKEPELIVQELIREDMAIVLPKNYPADHLASLEGYAVLYTEEGCSYREIFQGLLTDAGIQAGNIVETPSVEVIKRYVLCGIGISFLPVVTIAREIRDGSLRHIPWQSDAPVILQLALHKDKWVTPAMAEFIRMLAAGASSWGTDEVAE